MAQKAKTMKFLSIGRKKGAKALSDDTFAPPSPTSSGVAATSTTSSTTSTSPVLLTSSSNSSSNVFGSKGSSTISSRSSKRGKDGSSTISGRGTKDKPGLDKLFLPTGQEGAGLSPVEEKRSPRQSFLDGFLSAREVKPRDPSPIKPPSITTTTTTTTSSIQPVNNLRLDAQLPTMTQTQTSPRSYRESIFSLSPRKKQQSSTQKQKEDFDDLKQHHQGRRHGTVGYDPRSQSEQIESSFPSYNKTNANISNQLPSPTITTTPTTTSTRAISSTPRSDLAAKQRKESTQMSDLHYSSTKEIIYNNSNNSTAKLSIILNEEEEEEEEMMYHNLKDQEMRKNKVTSQRERYVKRKLFRISQRIVEGEQIEKYESEMLGRFENDQEERIYVPLPEVIFSAYSTILAIARKSFLLLSSLALLLSLSSPLLLYPLSLF
eukprot:TRINITY_DN436_c0_g2_i1.p1 TRINITY_DN436_c0_g2~~TRINITY_DN436_c0_g2_i1.p1  ORF type:complete len:433 (+),score=129.22 TRINITY_DN436_c0_g2_i1:174-1472(+)